MIRNIIYDLDGTIINSSKDIISSFNYAFKVNNLKIKINRNFFLNNANLGSKFFIKEAIKGNKTNISKLQDDFQKHYDSTFYKNSSLKKDVRKFLKFTKKKNLINILCTNKREKTAIKILKKYKIYNYFKFVVGYDTFKEKKPELKFVKKIFKKFKLKNFNTIMIGDTEIDSMLSMRAKIKFFLAEKGYTNKKNFSYYFKFKSFDQVKNKINEEL